MFSRKAGGRLFHTAGPLYENNFPYLENGTG